MNNMAQLTLFDNEDECELQEEGISERAQAGDIWILGDHRLMCGDSTSPEDLRLLTGGGVDGPGIHRSTLWHEETKRRSRQ